MVRLVTTTRHVVGAAPLSAAPPTPDRRPSASVAAQKAPTRLGVLRPVGPSHPVLACHRFVVGQVPLLPDDTSNSAPGVAYGSAFA